MLKKVIFAAPFLTITCISVAEAAAPPGYTDAGFVNCAAYPGATSSQAIINKIKEIKHLPALPYYVGIMPFGRWSNSMRAEWNNGTLVNDATYTYGNYAIPYGRATGYVVTVGGFNPDPITSNLIAQIWDGKYFNSSTTGGVPYLYQADGNGVPMPDVLGGPFTGEDSSVSLAASVAYGINDRAVLKSDISFANIGGAALISDEFVQINGFPGLYFGVIFATGFPQLAVILDFNNCPRSLTN